MFKVSGRINVEIFFEFRLSHKVIGYKYVENTTIFNPGLLGFFLPKVHVITACT